MTAIARQIPQVRRLMAAIGGGTQVFDCLEEKISHHDRESATDRRHVVAAASSEFTWIEAAAAAGIRLPRG